MSVEPRIKINSLAVAVPTTIMHMHAITATLPDGHGMTTESIPVALWKEAENYHHEWR